MKILLVCPGCRQRIIRQKYLIRFSSFVTSGKLIDTESSTGLNHPKLRRGRLSRTISDRIFKRSEQRYPSAKDEFLENLFSSTQQKSSGPPSLPYSPYSFYATLDKSFKALKSFLDQGTASPEESWVRCKQILSSISSSRNPKWNWDDIKCYPTWFVVLGRILEKSCQIKSQEPYRHSIPSPAEVINEYSKCKLMHNWWAKVVWIQLGVLIQRTHFILREFQSEEIPATENIVCLLEDIFDVWEMFMAEHGKPIQRHPLSKDFHRSSKTVMLSNRRAWLGVPHQQNLEIPALRTASSMPNRFALFLRQKSRFPESEKLAVAALLTFHCIQSILNDCPAYRSALEPTLMGADTFLHFIQRICRDSQWNRSIAIKYMLEQNVSISIIDTMLNKWGLKEIELNDTSVVKYVFTQSDANVTQGTGCSSTQDNSLLKDLATALHKSDARLAMESWRSFRSRSTTQKSSDIGAKIYLQFISVFFSLGFPAQAVEVWNHMADTGQELRQKHWHAMLLGCVKSKDLRSLQGVWSNMKAAGCEPDIYSWTAWINGLITLGVWERGLEALEELGKLWKLPSSSRLKGEAQTSLVPSIVPVNSAISALQDIKQAKLIPHVLKWAESQGLSQDTTTFNIRLRSLVRQERFDEVELLLSSMLQHGCIPDIKTFTIILNGLLSNSLSTLHQQNPAGQKTIMLTILRKMEEKGISANFYTYSTIVDGLLSSRIMNISAAHSVMRYMSHNTLKPSPHVFTILASFYFSSNPPDLPALETLWHNIQLQNGNLDAKFFCRMIEGYAHAGQFEKMFFFLRKAPEEGKSPSWEVLFQVLLALVEARKWDLVADLVRNVQDENESVMRYWQRDVRGQDRFWMLVDDLVRDGVVEVPQSKLD